MRISQNRVWFYVHITIFARFKVRHRRRVRDVKQSTFLQKQLEQVGIEMEFGRLHYL